MLKMPAAWRFNSPGELPLTAVGAFNDLVHAVAAQGGSWRIIELFKARFSGGSSWSSSESWAVSDLHSSMHAAAGNAATFIAAFWNGCEDVAELDPDIGLPDSGVINQILLHHGSPFELRPPELILRNHAAGVVLAPPVPSMSEQARTRIEGSFHEADRLLTEGRPRQAVQEILWLLETVSTAFQGQESSSGVIEGKYFNKIISELRKEHKEKPFAEALGWIVKLHGFLSSPTGGGIRHGTKLNDGIDVTMDDAVLYCNLTKSYVHYLLAILDRGVLSPASGAHF